MTSDQLLSMRERAEEAARKIPEPHRSKLLVVLASPTREWLEEAMDPLIGEGADPGALQAVVQLMLESMMLSSAIAAEKKGQKDTIAKLRNNPLAAFDEES